MYSFWSKSFQSVNPCSFWTACWDDITNIVTGIWIICVNCSFLKIQLKQSQFQIFNHRSITRRKQSCHILSLSQKNQGLRTVWSYYRTVRSYHRAKYDIRSVSASKRMNLNSKILYYAEFREISKLSFLSLNCHFWEKITKMITRVHSRILKKSPNIWFSKFSWKSP